MAGRPDNNRSGHRPYEAGLTQPPLRHLEPFREPPDESGKRYSRHPILRARPSADFGLSWLNSQGEIAVAAAYVARHIFSAAHAAGRMIEPSRVTLPQATRS